MLSLLFRNRWFALLWLVMSVAAASLFVSEDGGAGKLLDSAIRLREQRQALQRPPPTSSHVLEIESESVDTVPPVLLPAGDPDADPNDPQPGDIFIEAVSGRRVQIVAGAATGSDE